MAYRDKIEIDALYENTKFGIRMEYPSPWVGVELDEESENYVSVAQFCKKRRQRPLINESTPEKLKSLIIWRLICIAMSDVKDCISELESFGLETPKLNELNDSYEVENLVENLKQMLLCRL